MMLSRSKHLAVGGLRTGYGCGELVDRLTLTAGSGPFSCSVRSLLSTCPWRSRYSLAFAARMRRSEISFRDAFSSSCLEVKIQSNETQLQTDNNAKEHVFFDNYVAQKQTNGRDVLACFCLFRPYDLGLTLTF